MEQQKSIKQKNKFLTGFTIIELIVVVVIIAVLAAIVLSNVTQYSYKAKITRANVDVQNIENALNLFYVQYGDSPYSQEGNPLCPAPGCNTEFYGSNNGGTDPYLLATDGLTQKHLSQFYNSDYNADYFVKNGYYDVYLEDLDGDGKIGCGVVSIYDTNGNFYGLKFIICQDCPDTCDGTYDIPFSTSPE